MPIIISPRFNRRIIHQKYDVDVQFVGSTGRTALDNEDVLRVNVANWNFQGIQNKLFGTNAAIRGEHIQDLSPRGLKVSTHREEQFIEHLDLR